jgi:flagellar hook-associated protein 2
MLNVDGLITGLDTTRIIEGLLSIQQQQIDRIQTRRQQIVDKQTAFKGIEAALLSFQGTVRNLTRTGDNALLRKQVVSSDDSVLQAAVSNQAAAGIYQMRVTQLARSHQVASQLLESANAELAVGTYTLQVGTQSPLEVSIDETNNSLQGFADALNDLRGGVSASVLHVGDGFRLLLTSSQTGQAQTIQILSQPSASDGSATVLAFDLENPVQQAQDAQLVLGSGPGAITVQSESNQVDDLIQGVTIDLLRAVPDQEVALTVSQDIETARNAVMDFVEAYNEVISQIEEQQRFDTETGTAALLFGDRSLLSIRDTLSRHIFAAVPGAPTAMNRLSALGLRPDATGKLIVRGSQLDDVLNGRVEGVRLDDVQRLFGVYGESDSAHLRFVRAGSQTQPSPIVTEAGQQIRVPYEVQIVQAAERASVVAGTSLAESISIDASNRTLNLIVDGQQTSTLSLVEGTYLQDDLLQHLQQAINADDALRGRRVSVALQDGRLEISSELYGESSEITIVSGTALNALGFVGGETDHGVNVVGHFLVQGERENAVGRGRLLTGNQVGAATQELQIEVNLTADQVGSGFSGNLYVSRGIAAQLDNALDQLFASEGNRKGTITLAQESFAEQIESLDENVADLEARFESRRLSLLAEFARLESAVSDLQSIGNLMAVQLAGLPQIGSN